MEDIRYKLQVYAAMVQGDDEKHRRAVEIQKSVAEEYEKFKQEVAARSEARIENEAAAHFDLAPLKEMIQKLIPQENVSRKWASAGFNFSNERNWPEVIRSLSAALLPSSRQPRVHFGVSGLQNEAVMAARKSDIALLIDIEEATVNFHQKLDKAFQEFPLSAEGLTPEKTESFIRGKLGFSADSRLPPELSWARDTDQFLHLQNMFREGRVFYFRMDFMNEQGLRRIIEALKGTKMDTVYLSNIADWVNLPASDEERHSNYEALKRSLEILKVDSPILIVSKWEGQDEPFGPKLYARLHRTDEFEIPAPQPRSEARTKNVKPAYFDEPGFQDKLLAWPVLTPQQKKILEERVIGGKTLQLTATPLKIGRERVRQVEARALEKADYFHSYLWQPVDKTRLDQEPVLKLAYFSALAKKAFGKLEIRSIQDLQRKTEYDFLIARVTPLVLEEIQAALQANGFPALQAEPPFLAEGVDILDQNITALGKWSARVRSVFKRLKIKKAGDLTARSADELKGPNFGETSLAEIRTVLAQHKLVLHGDPPLLKGRSSRSELRAKNPTPELLRPKPIGQGLSLEAASQPQKFSGTTVPTKRGQSLLVAAVLDAKTLSLKEADEVAVEIRAEIGREGWKDFAESFRTLAYQKLQERAEGHSDQAPMLAGVYQFVDELLGPAANLKTPDGSLELAVLFSKAAGRESFFEALFKAAGQTGLVPHVFSDSDGRRVMARLGSKAARVQLRDIRDGRLTLGYMIPLALDRKIAGLRENFLGLLWQNEGNLDENTRYAREVVSAAILIESARILSDAKYRESLEAEVNQARAAHKTDAEIQEIRIQHFEAALIRRLAERGYPNVQDAFSRSAFGLTIQGSQLLAGILADQKARSEVRKSA
jgi:hypothetical protein